MPEIRHVDANGLRFAYLEEGTGPLVLLLHGFPDTAHTWDDLRPRLAARGFRAVSPFMRGFHPTALPDHDATQETLARDALALIEALGEESAVVVGHDWGATAAYGAAAMAPGKIRTLITLAIPHPATLTYRPKKLWGARHFFGYKAPGAVARFAAHDLAALPAICRRWSPSWNPPPAEFEAVRACFAHPGSLDAAFGYYRALTIFPPAWLKAPITVPTMAYFGKDDSIAGRSDFEKAARIFRGEYRFEELPGGHFLHREYPDLFAERLLAHLGP